MTQTIAGIATRALADDMDVGRQTEAELYVREAIGEIYRNTRLHRGDVQMTLFNLGVGATQLLGTGGAMIRFDSIIFADNGDELRPIDYGELVSLRAQNPDIARRPEVYAPLGNLSDDTLALQIWPKTDQAYQLFIAGAAEPLSADLDPADAAPLPDTWLKLPYYYARAELFAIDGDGDEDARWRALWINGCSALRSDLQRRISASRIIPGTWANLRSNAPTFHYGGLF